MNGEISFRHNVMTIQSLDTFINIRGGFSLGRKDVYFVRAIGECPDFLKKFKALDSMLGDQEKENRIRYLRLKDLPNSMEKQVSEFYTSTYAEWKQGKPIRTKNRSASKNFEKVLANATRETLEKYKTVRPNISESMIRNFVIKLWYWADLFLGDVIKDWSEYLNVKVVSDNMVKPQEYLFCYFATLLGFDVLILNNRSDINLSDNIRHLSSELILGSFGTVVLPEQGKNTVRPYDRTTEGSPKHIIQGDEKNEVQRQEGQSAKVLSQTNRVDSTTKNNKGNRRITSERTDRQVAKGTPAATDNNRNNSSAPSIINTRQEKSFEELAQLASSIVMIAVHDKKGNPVATGSGIMIGKKGFILTNCHVVKGGIFFAVRNEDDQKVYITREVIKYNPQLDLAVLRIDRALKPLPVYDGRKKLVRGQRVVAIGSPLGLFNSVSNGIISGFRRIKDVDMIQFTAPISHGSSGGAVLNMNGEIIGISTAGIDSGQNINLAVDYSSIRFFAQGFF